MDRHPEADPATTGITMLFERLASALAARDVEALVGLYTPDAVLFDLAPPLVTHGQDRAGIAAWFATWDGPITVEAHDHALQIDGGIAFASSLEHMRGAKAGVAQDIWYRATRCLKRQGGRWLIVHEHTSVPFYMDGSLRAATDLTR